MKKNDEKKNTEKAPPEKYFAVAIDIFFSFHKHHFRDDDGYALAPDWNQVKRGMEMKSLKLILQTLRGISEGKKIEWTEDCMKIKFQYFLEKAYANPFIRKNFLLAMMNRYKFDILCSSYNPSLVKKILEVWYFEFPDYARDLEKDKAAAEVIIGFLKQQYVLNSVPWSEDSVVSSVKIIFNEIKCDDFWSKKSLKSISNNLQEFVNKIKARKNETRGKDGISSDKRHPGKQKPFSASDSKIAAIKQWGVKTSGSGS